MTSAMEQRARTPPAYQAYLNDPANVRLDHLVLDLIYNEDGEPIIMPGERCCRHPDILGTLFFKNDKLCSESALRKHYTDVHKVDKLVSHPFAKPDLDAVADHKQYPSSNLMVDVSAISSRMSNTIAREAANTSTDTKGIKLLRDKRGIKFEANPNDARAAGQSRLVFIISSTVVSQKTCAAQAFRMPVNIYYSGRSSAAYLWFPMPIVPLLLVFDECYIVKDEQTSQFWKRPDDIYQFSSSHPHQTQ
ncbi:hypothetical protein J3F84DRAFT_350113 [Trichoderma pleuroticola]